jgi:hypothetical protein
VEGTVAPQLSVLAGGGVVAGLALLVRGFSGYRTASRISDIATSRIATLAAGEVRVTGIVEPAEVVLVSALQSVPCVYYRATIRESRDDDREAEVLDEERAIGFRIRDATGDLRVFPRSARWDVPVRFADRSSALEGEPAGLNLRTGPAYTSAQPDEAAQVAALLGLDRGATAAAPSTLRAARGARRYAEVRVEPGDTVTVVGRAVPFGQLADPAEADVASSDMVTADDPEVAANIAEAREAGLLRADPEEAWGNAAIPGFGIGRPVREPELDPAADRPLLAPAEEAERTARTFEIAPERLVLVAGPGLPLLVALGDPTAAATRNRSTFVLGLLGAVLAIGSAIALAFSVAPGLGR